MKLEAAGATYTVDTSRAHVATVIGPVISDRNGKADLRTDDELTATLHLRDLSLAEVQRLQGETVAIFVVSQDAA